MARNTGRRQQNRPAADWNHFYVYGSAVRQPEALPSGNGTVRKPKKKRTSRQVIKNRHRAQRIFHAGYRGADRRIGSAQGGSRR